MSETTLTLSEVSRQIFSKNLQWEHEVTWTWSDLCPHNWVQIFSHNWVETWRHCIAIGQQVIRNTNFTTATPSPPCYFMVTVQPELGYDHGLRDPKRSLVVTARRSYGKASASIFQNIFQSSKVSPRNGQYSSACSWRRRWHISVQIYRTIKGKRRLWRMRLEQQ